MVALAVSTDRAGAADGLEMGGPAASPIAGPEAADRSAAESRPGRMVRSWPLLVLAVPAAAEVWSGWTGIAQKTGFGMVAPLPGIWPSLHLDTAITLPVGVEAYAAYALRAWLATEHAVSARTRRFAKWSAVFSMTLGMAGQVTYHLLAQAGVTRAPWPITTAVSCLPVLVLAMGTALAHMLRADADTTTDASGDGTAGPVTPPSPAWSPEDQAGLAQDQSARQAPLATAGLPDMTRTVPQRDHDAARIRTPGLSEIDQARLAASRLTAAGKPISRRALRSEGIKGSNQALNALARMINAELAGTSALPARPGNAVL